MLYCISVFVMNGEFCTRERESSQDLEYLDPKYLINYTDGVDPVHCTKGTCNLSELIGVNLICEATYQTWVFTTYLLFKTSQGIESTWEVAVCYC